MVTAYNNSADFAEGLVLDGVVRIFNREFGLDAFVEFFQTYAVFDGGVPYFVGVDFVEQHAVMEFGNKIFELRIFVREMLALVAHDLLGNEIRINAFDELNRSDIELNTLITGNKLGKFSYGDLSFSKSEYGFQFLNAFDGINGDGGGLEGMFTSSKFTGISY